MIRQIWVWRAVQDHTISGASKRVLDDADKRNAQPFVKDTIATGQSLIRQRMGGIRADEDR